MRCGFKTYESIASQHKRKIIERKFHDVAQLGYDRNPVKRLWRFLKQKRIDVWRTYWKGMMNGSIPVFIKVYFGYSDKNFDQLMGKKEVALEQYYNSIHDLPNDVVLPHVLDHWGSETGYFVTYEWRNLHVVDLGTLLRKEKLRDTFFSLLHWLRQIPPPPWWTRKFEEQNYAYNDDFLETSDELSPFDFDLDRNICLTEDGALYFHDFEKHQWTPRGLQDLYVCFSILDSSYQQTYSINEGFKICQSLFDSIGTKFPIETLNQAAKAYEETIERISKMTVNYRMALLRNRKALLDMHITN
jgi:hypothetical protein